MRYIARFWIEKPPSDIEGHKVYFLMVVEASTWEQAVKKVQNCLCRWKQSSSTSVTKVEMREIGSSGNWVEVQQVETTKPNS